jgi:hypothetical protein
MDVLVELITRNAYLVLGTFAISVLANLLQISTYLRDRRRIRREILEREQLLGQLEKYRYVVGLAERSIMAEEQLKEIEEDVLDWRTTAKEIETRVAQMQQIAQRKMVQNAIEKSTQNLVSAYEDVKMLREKYAELGPLPDIPPNARAEIEREVSVAVTIPYELPKVFVFRALLLLLLAILLPWPVNTVVTLVFLHIFFALFFDAATMYADPKVTGWIFRHADAIGRWSAVGLWFVLLNFLQNIILIPLEDLIKNEYTWSASMATTVTIAIIGGALHWRAVRDHALHSHRAPRSADAMPAQAES